MESVLTLEQTLVVLLLQSQELTGSLTDLGQSVLDPPDLTLVAQTIVADDLQLLVQASLLVRTTGRHVGLGEYRRGTSVHHLVAFVRLCGTCEEDKCPNISINTRNFTNPPTHGGA